MSPERSLTERIRDILDAVAEIQAFTTEMDFEDFRRDSKTIKAVELNFIVIGEAASHVPEGVEAAHPEIPWHLMRAMRNRLVHVYFSVDPKIVWDTVHGDLPSLVVPLQDLLSQLEDE